jgi:nucleotide-binding universal stress UspA family protein
VDVDRVAALEAALEMQGPGDGANRARLLATLAAEVTYGPDRTRTQRLADEALQIARQLDDQRTLAHVLMARGFMLGLDTARSRMAESAELQAVADELGDPVLGFLGLFARAVAAFEVGEPTEAMRCLDRARERSESVGQPFMRWVLALEDALVALFHGDLARAEQLIELAADLGTSAGQPDARVLGSAQLGYLRLEQGRGGEVEGLLSEMHALAPAQPSLRSQLALSRWQAGRVEEAKSLAEELTRDLEVLPREAAWGRAVTQMAMLCAELQDASMARRVYELLEPYAGLFVSSGVVFSGAVDLHLGVLAAVLERFDEAEAHFTTAHRMHEDAGAPAWLARTRLEWGQMLQKRGDSERSRPLLEQALAIAAEIGQGSVERRARDALQP